MFTTITTNLYNLFPQGTQLSFQSANMIAALLTEEKQLDNNSEKYDEFHDHCLQVEW
jgi:hypothetical protein